MSKQKKLEQQIEALIHGTPDEKLQNFRSAEAFWVAYDTTIASLMKKWREECVRRGLYTEEEKESIPQSELIDCLGRVEGTSPLRDKIIEHISTYEKINEFKSYAIDIFKNSLRSYIRPSTPGWKWLMRTLSSGKLYPREEA